jgi:hypothetical protein
MQDRPSRDAQSWRGASKGTIHMHALWRLLLRLKRLRLLALVTGLPIIGIGAYLVQYAAKLALDQQLTDVFKAESPNWFKFTLVAVAACAIGWILGFQGFTFVRCCGSPRASSPHGLTAEETAC